MEQIQSELINASQGLFMMSETDAPFEVVHFEDQDKESFSESQLLNLLGKPADTPVETQELGYFLRNMAKAREGASERKLKEVARFQSLQGLLLDRLTDVKVYRVGKTRIDSYILGWAPGNQLVGLKTFQVET